MRVLLAVSIALVLTVHLATVFAQSRPPPPPPPYVVIVHAANPNASVSRKFLADAFLKKVTRWPNGEVIRPVDLDAESAVRRKFDDDVLNRSVAAVKSYWQQIIFSGRDVPPPELSTDEEVVKFVLKYNGAIGYVSGGAQVSGVQVVSVQ